MRLFFAISLPSHWSDALGRQDLSGVEGRRGRQTAAANLHITQLFLGEMADSRLLLEMPLSLSSFTLLIDRLCLTANRRMVWLRFQPNDTFALNGRLLQECFNMHSNMHSQIRTGGRDSFIPHITLLRGHNLRLKRPLSLPHPLSEDSSLPVTHYELWQSQLTHQGARYLSLGKIALMR